MTDNATGCDNCEVLKDGHTSRMLMPSNLRVVFMGTPDFSVPSLLTLINSGFDVAAVVTQPDKPQGRHMTMTAPPVKIVAQEHGIDVLQPDKVRDLEFIAILKSYKPDLIVTAAYGKILPESILNLPRYGCVNVHASLLPLYRGAAPVQWCIINGDRISGITIMKMDKGMDTGDILLQETVDIHAEMTSGELMELLANTGAKMLSGAILDFCNGCLQPVPQDEKLATSVKPISKEDGLIDWNHSVESIHNQIRGCNPWPVAYTFYKTKRLKIFTAVIPSETTQILCNGAQIPFNGNEQLPYKPETPPGSLLQSNDRSRLFVQCLNGVLEILELGQEGSKRMHAKDCAHNFSSGVFGIS